MGKEQLGKKIVIVGISASGKSAFGQRLSESLGLPVTFMDKVMWRPGWQYVGDEETATVLDEITQGEVWLIEGYVVGVARPMVFQRADTVIYLDYPRHISLWRYLKRVWKHRQNPRPELPGSPESFSPKFLWRVWTKGEAISLEKHLNEMENPNKLITLKSPKETKKFLSQVS